MIECVKKRRPKRLIDWTVYHIESPALGCDRPLIYMGYWANGWQFVKTWVDDKPQTVIQPRREGAKERMMTHIHVPDGSR